MANSTQQQILSTRKLPFNSEAEQAVLGAVLANYISNNSTKEQSMDIINSNDIKKQGYDLSEKAVKMSDKEAENCIDKAKSNPGIWKEYVEFGYTENMAFISVFDGVDNGNIYCWKENPKTKV